MNIFRNALQMLVLMTLLTGVAYPLLVTGVAQVIFPEQANGSLLYRDDKPVALSPSFAKSAQKLFAHAAARVAADMAAAGWKRDAEGRMVRADAETTEA